MMLRPINQLPDFVKEKLSQFDADLSKVGVLVVLSFRLPLIGRNFKIKGVYSKSGDSRNRKIKSLKDYEFLHYLMLADVVIGEDNKIYKNRYGDTDGVL